MSIGATAVSTVNTLLLESIKRHEMAIQAKLLICERVYITGQHNSTVSYNSSIVVLISDDNINMIVAMRNAGKGGQNESKRTI